jgi:phage terminase large subunit
LTWLCVAWALHRWLFFNGFKATFGSRKQTLVDQIGNPDAIFEKLRLLFYALPWWMQPRAFVDNEMKLLNRDNGSAITGEAGDNMGRGGRSSIYFIDEAAFIDRPDKVDAAISNNSDCKIKISTPNGSGNPFAQQRHSGNFPVFTLHWLEDPRKNAWMLSNETGEAISSGTGRDAPPGAIYPWYEKQKRVLNRVVLAQEVDLDYNASLEGVCIEARWVQAAIDLCHRIKFPEIGAIAAGFDVADGGANLNVFIPRRGAVVLGIVDWATGNTTQTAYKARDLGREWAIARLHFDCLGPGTGVHGTLSSCDNVPFDLEPVNGGDRCTDRYWEQFGDRPSSDIFINLRAELWWLLRTRFEKTYEHLHGIQEHPLEDLISIPNHGVLIGQLSQPLVLYDDTGKIKIESKKDMARRGVPSPDFADALAYAFAPPQTRAWAVSHQSGWGYSTGD